MASQEIPPRDSQQPNDEPRGDHAAVGLLIAIVLLLGLAIIAVILSTP